MKTFLEFFQQYDEAGGMGTISAKCMQCGESQRVSRYAWNSGKARCKNCGGGLDTSSGIDDDPKAKLRSQIAELEANRETQIGASISDEININNHDPADVYAHYGVDEKTAQAMMDKAAHLFTLKRKLAKLDPEYASEFELDREQM